MKFLHIADTHMGVDTHGPIDFTTGRKGRLADFQRDLDFAIGHGIEEGVDIIFHSGDITDMPNPSTTLQDIIAEAFAYALQRGIHLVLVTGNHDNPQTEYLSAPAQVFGRLSELVHVFRERTVEVFHMPNSKEAIQVIALPWPNLRQKIDGKMPSEEEQVARAEQEHREFIEANCHDDIPTVIVGHFTVVGAALAGSERSTLIMGKEIQLTVEELAQGDVVYVAMGHIHKAQDLNRGGAFGNGAPVVYPGATSRLNFNEEGVVPGYVIGEIHPAAPIAKIAGTYSFHGTETREFVTVKVDVSGRGEDPTDLIVAAIKERSVGDCICRVIVDADKEQRREIDKKRIRSYFVEAYSLTSIKVNVPDMVMTTPTGVKRSMPVADALEKWLQYVDITGDYAERIRKFSETLVEEVHQESSIYDSIQPYTPVSVTMEGFRKYTERTTIPLSGMGPTCIVGDIGAGKSSIGDALPYALWGVGNKPSEARKPDETMMNSGVDEMAVEHEFQIGETRYRVVRCAKRGKKGTLTRTLAFYHYALGAWEPVTTSHKLDTVQGEINKVIGISPDVFYAACYVRQNHSGFFARSKRSERRTILARAIGEGGYEKLHALSDKRRKHVEKVETAERLALENVVEIIDTHDTLGEYDAVLNENQQKIDAAHKRLTALGPQRDKLLAGIHRNEAAESRNAEAKEALPLARTNLDNATTLLGRNERELALRQVEADKEPGLRTALEKLTEAETVMDSADAAQWHEFIIATAAVQANTELLSTDELSAEVLEATTAQQEIQNCEKTNFDFVTSIAACATDIERHTATRKQATSDLAELRLQLKNLMSGEDTTCDRCGQPTGGEHATKLRQGLGVDIEGCDQAEHAAADAEQESRNERSAIQLRQGVYVEGIAGFTETAALLGNLTERLGQAIVVRDAGLKAIRIESEIDTGAIATAAKFVTDNAFARSDHQIAVIADNRVEGLTASIAVDKQRIEEMGVNIVALEKQLEQDADAIAKLPKLRKALDAIDASLSGVASERDEALQVHTTATGQRVALAGLLTQRESILRDLTGYEDTAEAYVALTKAYSKNGIPALIIDETLPELEEHANELLHEVTNGEFTIHLIGDGEDLEPGDLEIMIEDDTGHRRVYESYSGGQGFQIDMALTYGQSRIVGERNGVQLRFLFVDEGFGTQSKQGVDAMLTALKRRHEYFPSLFVISHLPAVREAFSSIISVTLDPARGSLVELP